MEQPGIATPSRFAGRRAGKASPPHAGNNNTTTGVRLFGDDKPSPDLDLGDISLHEGQGIRKPKKDPYSDEKKADAGIIPSTDNKFSVPPVDTGRRKLRPFGSSQGHDKGNVSTKSADASQKDILVSQTYDAFRSPRTDSSGRSSGSGRRSRRTPSSQDSRATRKEMPGRRRRIIATPVSATSSSSASTSRSRSRRRPRKRLIRKPQVDAASIELDSVVSEHMQAQHTQGVPLPPSLGGVAEEGQDAREAALVRTVRSPARTPMQAQAQPGASPSFIPRHPAPSPSGSPLVPQQDGKATPSRPDGLSWLQQLTGSSRSQGTPASSSSTPQSLLNMEDPGLPKMKKKRGPFRCCCQCGVLWKDFIVTVLFLLAAEYLAVSAFCWGFDWWKLYDCVSLDGVACGYRACTETNLALVLVVTACNVFLGLFWVLGEFLVQRAESGMANEGASGKQWQKELDAYEKRQGGVPGIERTPVHPKEWNEELKQWKQQRSKVKKGHSSGIYFRALSFYFIYFFVIVLIFFIILESGPQTADDQEFWGPVYGLIDWEISGAYGYLVLGVVVWELFTMVVVLATVRWPEKGIERDINPATIQRDAKELERRDSSEYLDETQGLIPDTAVIITCHKSCQTESAVAAFRKTLRAALKIFAANQIFVVDNGPGATPADRTHEVCASISRKLYPDGDQAINYLYVPEGNKTHAIYWATEYWIPQLYRRGAISRDFTWALIIDDDVVLPKDLQIPLRSLRARPHVQAVSFAISAKTETGKSNFLVSLQDAEYKVVGAVKQFQNMYGTTLFCHGAIGLWKRPILGKAILWDHDTEFHGEDLNMGLLLHRLKKNYKIETAAAVVVDTYAPETIAMLFRQRSKSWDLCSQRRVLNYLRFVLFTWSRRVLVLKPFLLYECIVVFLDYIRLFLIAGLAYRNPAGLGLLALAFMSLIWVSMICFNKLVLKYRRDLRLSCMTVTVFPFYKLFGLTFRLHALLRNALKYSAWKRRGLTISLRQERYNDLPPVPSMDLDNIDWWTVWRVAKQEIEQNGSDAILRKYLDDTIPPLMKYPMTALDRSKAFDYLEIFYRSRKLQLELDDLKFPGMLHHAGVDTTSIESLEDLMVDLRLTITNAVGATLGRNLHGVRGIIDEMTKGAHDAKRHVVISPDLLRGLKERQMESFVLLLYRIIRQCEHMEKVLQHMRYPQNQDKARAVHDALIKVMNMSARVITLRLNR